MDYVNIALFVAKNWIGVNMKHIFYTRNSNNLDCIPDKSIQLIVTSPPYPMIEMWDDVFNLQKHEINNYIKDNPNIAFYKMHNILNQVWMECDRVLADNCFICINIGDATKTIDNKFQVYPNHVEIINFFFNLGYSVLPNIIWHKPTNAPNKFMGSGMYPSGAYVTQEHEYILIFRKGENRKFTAEEKERRQRSSYFWEERNVWFSDLWDIKGTSQTITNTKTRERNASYPFEIPYRLVNMYSIEGDTVLDPFGGLGTTSLACIASQRNSISVDIDEEITNKAIENVSSSCDYLNNIINNRIFKHIDFVNSLNDEKKCKYFNNIHNFDVKTRQEENIKINKVKSITVQDNQINIFYER